MEDSFPRRMGYFQGLWMTIDQRIMQHQLAKPQLTIWWLSEIVVFATAMGFLWPSPFFAEKDRFKGAVAQRACRSDVSLGWSSRWSESNRFSSWWVKFFQWVDKNGKILTETSGKHRYFPMKIMGDMGVSCNFSHRNQPIDSWDTQILPPINQPWDHDQPGWSPPDWWGMFFRKVPWKRSAMLPDVASFKTLHWVFRSLLSMGMKSIFYVQQMSTLQIYVLPQSLLNTAPDF